MIIFNKYDYLKLKDLRRCPFPYQGKRTIRWDKEDNHRLLLIALDRYADKLKNEPRFT